MLCQGIISATPRIMPINACADHALDSKNSAEARPWRLWPPRLSPWLMGNDRVATRACSGIPALIQPLMQEQSPEPSCFHHSKVTARSPQHLLPLHSDQNYQKHPEKQATETKWMRPIVMAEKPDRWPVGGSPQSHFNQASICFLAAHVQLQPVRSRCYQIHTDIIPEASATPLR